MLSKGYEQMSIQDVLADLQISGGAFHHYFDSRGALLAALIDRIEQDSTRPLLPIVHDPRLNAIEKLQELLHALDRLREERQDDVLVALRVWYTDSNAVVRERVDEAVLKQRTPLLTAIVRQGQQEGVFQATSPAHAGEIVMALLQAMGHAHARLLLSPSGDAADIGATYDAYMEAIERVIGAPANSLQRADLEAVTPWVIALRERCIDGGMEHVANRS